MNLEIVGLEGEKGRLGKLEVRVVVLPRII